MLSLHSLFGSVALKRSVHQDNELTCFHRRPWDEALLAELEALVDARFHRFRKEGMACETPRASEPAMHPDTHRFNEAQPPDDAAIRRILAREIDTHLPEAENKIWHAHPVWFLDGNPVVGYSRLKECVRLLFWSGQSFHEDGLQNQGTFRAAEARYTSVEQVDVEDLARWLARARNIQWD